jgi:hypothetical protein
MQQMAPETHLFVHEQSSSLVVQFIVYGIKMRGLVDLHHVCAQFRQVRRLHHHGEVEHAWCITQTQSLTEKSLGKHQRFHAKNGMARCRETQRSIRELCQGSNFSPHAFKKILIKLN